MYYTVSEVAKRLELSPHTIRFYSKEGLLDFVERDQNGNRIFKESDFERLFIIASLKRSVMSIKQIREFTLLCDKGDPTIGERLKIITNQREKVEEEIKNLAKKGRQQRTLPPFTFLLHYAIHLYIVVPYHPSGGGYVP